jgi:hypothetical protein
LWRRNNGKRERKEREGRKREKENERKMREKSPLLGLLKMSNTIIFISYFVLHPVKLKQPQMPVVAIYSS